MSTQSTLNRIASHLVLFLEPVRSAAGDLASFQSLLRKLGLKADSVPGAYTNLANDLATLIDQVEALPDDAGIGDVAPIFDALKPIFSDVAGLPMPPGNTGVVEDIGTRLVDLLLVEYLAKAAPLAFNALKALGVIQQTLVPAVDNPPRAAFVLIEMKWDQLGASIKDPLSIAPRLFAWGLDEFDFSSFADAILGVASSWGMRGTLEFIDDQDERDSYLADPETAEAGREQRLNIIFADGTVLDTPFTVGVAVSELPADQNHTRGFVIEPIAPSTFSDPIELTDELTLTIQGGTDLASTFGVLVRPLESLVVQTPFSGNAPSLSGRIALVLGFRPADRLTLLGGAAGTRIDLAGVDVTAELLADQQTGFEVRLTIQAKDLKLSIDMSDGDGFTDKVGGGREAGGGGDVGIRWSSRTGAGFVGSGGLELTLPGSVDLGPLHIDDLGVLIEALDRPGSGGLGLEAHATIVGELGPVTVTVQGIGFRLDFDASGGNAGRFGVGAGFVFPKGIGIAVDGGAISGGGFLSFAPGRYSGAIELEAYSISIKAFGLIETGAAGTGFSMVIVISAEFATPIQLGLGFTLNGVGGMIGINRTVNSDALRALVVAGRTENLLFPKNVIANAPAIIRDLGTVFPAREGHYVFGPLAKLGWGTPTLITAELALILELPGPVLSLIGEVKCLLPKPDVALVKFNMSIAGQLDFPQKSFSLDAALHDSVIEGYPVSGQMALRLRWGEQPNFALSIGGFHPAYQPPANFPKLQPMTVALAQTGSSTSVTVSGFFALTSNTLQIGGEARLHAGGSGISLDASIAVKTIFIFSPFSFAANVDASVKISFHGHGPSVHLSGVLSGPSPWRAKGEVCVSILWWDACLRFDQTFGGTTTVPEPTLDPWQGSSTVQGLLGALQDPKNWAALPPPGSFTVVSRAPGASDLVDPLGGFTVRQKAVPVETTLAIARFGPARAAEPAANRTGPIFFKGAMGSYGTSIPLAQADVLKDFFAPAQFFELNDAKKLSAKSFDKYGAGYSFAIKPNNIEAGSIGTKPIQYTTKILGSGGTVTDPQLHDLPPEHLAAKSATSAVAKGGFAQSGTRRYVDPAFTQPFVINDVGFTLANADNLQAVTPGAAPLPRADALVALDDYIALHPEKRGQVQVVATYELAA